MAFKNDKDRYTKYTITYLQKMYKPELFVEPDLGIPLDLLDLSVYKERQIKEIEAVFEASKLRPVHATNKNLPVEVMPLLPDFDRCEDQFAIVTFDGAPTADSEIFSKLHGSVREEHESRLWKDMYDELEDISYSWIREYNWDLRGDNANDPTTYLVSFDDGIARYVNYCKEEISSCCNRIERARGLFQLEGCYFKLEDGLDRPRKLARHQDIDQYSGSEDDLSD